MVVTRSRPRARLPRWSLTLLAAAGFLAAIWSVLWLFLSNRADGAFQAWLAAERADGRQWTCPGRHLGGYPFAVTLECDRPTFRGEVAGRAAEGSVEGLTAEVRLDRPRRVGIVLRSPLVLRSEADDFAFTASWDAMTATIDNVASRAMSGAFAASRLAVTLQTVRQGDLNLRAGAASGEAAPSPTGPGDAGFSLTADGLAFPTADALPGLEGPADLAARGVLGRADLLRAPTRALLETWRTAGGALHLSALNVSKGSFRCEASGALALDDEHRPAGRLDTSVSGFEALAARFGIPIAGVQIGGLLSSLLGGGKAPPAEPGSVRLPLVLREGAAFVGPIRTGVRLDPLY